MIIHRSLEKCPQAGVVPLLYPDFRTPMSGCAANYDGCAANFFKA